MNLRETPGTVSENNRHRRPWKDGSRTPLVELVDPDRGTLMMCRIKVPSKYARKAADTNEGLVKARIINEGLRKWELMRQAKGDTMISPPQLKEITSPIGASPDTPVDDSFVYYWFTAFFRSLFAKYAKLDDVLEINRLADVHDVDLKKAWRPWAGSSRAKKNPDSDWLDPLKYAEERRQKKGIRRKDYLLDNDGDLSKPLRHVNSPEVEKALKRRKA